MTFSYYYSFAGIFFSLYFLKNRTASGWQKNMSRVIVCEIQ